MQAPSISTSRNSRKRSTFSEIRSHWRGMKKIIFSRKDAKAAKVFLGELSAFARVKIDDLIHK